MALMTSNPEYPQFGSFFDQPCQSGYSCFLCRSKFGVTIRFDWGLQAQVHHLEHLLVPIDHLHHLLRLPG